MPSATLVSPSTMYTGPPPPYSYPSSTTASSVPGLSGLISPPDSRRTSDDEKEPRQAQRQSLPSIHEALSGDQPLSYSGPPPASIPPQPTQNPPSALSSTPISRSSPANTDLPSGPRPLPTGQATPYSTPSYQTPVHQQQPPYSSSDPSIRPSAPTSYESKLPSLLYLNTTQSPVQPNRPTPPHPPQSQRSPLYEQGSKFSSPMNPPYGYAGYPPQYYSQAPNGPPTAYPPSAGYQGASNPHTTWRSDGSEINRVEENRKTAPRGGSLGGQAYGESVKRHLDIFDLEHSLNEIAEGSGQILDFSRHYGARAHQTQRSGPIPGSLPTLAECDEMLKQQTRIHDSLSCIREVLVTQQHALAEQRVQDQGFKGSSEFDVEDSAMYHDDAKGGGFAGSDAKKRRGRAAPPDYAKLTRKMGNKAAIGGSNLRPKSMGPGSPQ
ncbi:MAG: hypothetical protein M1819_005674 [Sarea resinae]|nr:MAG: hypothetical protein M1819_005674 [Sarea resinae]